MVKADRKVLVDICVTSHGKFSKTSVITLQPLSGSIFEVRTSRRCRSVLNNRSTLYCDMATPRRNQCHCIICEEGLRTVNWERDSCHLQLTATVLQRSCNICAAGCTCKLQPCKLGTCNAPTNSWLTAPTAWGRVLEKSKKNPRILFKPQVHYRVHKSLTLVRIVNKMNTVPAPWPYFFTFQFNIILSSTSCYSERPLTFRILRHNQH